MGPRKLVSVCSALLILTSALLPFPPNLPAQSEDRIRLLVVPVENVSERSQLEAVASTVTDTIILTLRLLDRYEVTRYGGLLEFPPDLEELSLLAGSAPAENILYGAVSSPEDGATVELRVYDRLQGREVLSQQATAATLLDVFEVADELTAEVVSAFSGRRIAFGALRLIAQGATDRPYQVYLDGNRVGRNRERVDSVLTGTHLLRIVAETERGEEEVYNRQISIEEGGSAQVRFDIPDYTDEELAAAAAAARMERDLAALLEEQAALEEEWAAVESGELEDPPALESISLALEVLQTADDYPDGERMRTTAREPILFMADRLVDYGQEQLADAELDAGAAAFRELASLGAALPPAAELEAPGAAPLREIDNYHPETSYVAQRWSEERLHTERRFASLVGVGLTSAATYFAFDYSNEPKVGDGPLYYGAQSVPLLFAAGFTALQLGWDHDAWGDTRSLERYGRRGNMRDGEFLDSAVPGTLALGLGAVAEWGSAIRELKDSPDPGLGEPSSSYSMSPDEPDLRLSFYWQATRHDSLGLHYRISFWGSDKMYTEEADLLLDDDPSRTIEKPYDFQLTWDHTRTGKWFTRLGLGYAQLQDGRAYQDNSTGSDALDAYYEELLGDDPIHTGTLSLGLGRFLGRGRRAPWEILVHYRLLAIYFSGPYLQTPDSHHRIGLSLGKRIPLGRVAGATWPGIAEDEAEAEWPSATESEDGPASEPEWADVFPSSERRAEARYGPGPVSLYTDLGGLAFWGPRFGGEYNLGNGWTVGAFLRWYQYGTTYADFYPMPKRVGPGAAVRRYPGAGPAESGWFYGGLFEYRNNNYLFEESTDTSGDRLVEENWGHVFILSAEGGHRFVRRGGRFIDLGAFVGLNLGRSGYRDEIGQSEAGNGGAAVVGLILSVGTPW